MIVTQFLEQLQLYWIWFGVATLLLLVEVFAGSFRFMAASVAALIVGVLSHFFPYVEFPVQLLFFGVIAAVLVWTSSFYLNARMKEVNRLREIVASKAYVGREVKLVGGIRNGFGSAHIDDVVWPVNGQDCPAGSQVKVVDMSGAKLIVEPLA